jgi:hypothetical protein
MSHTVTEHPPIYGIMAEFDSAEALVEAARAASAEGYHKMDAYSPLPIEELHDVLHIHDNRVSLACLIGGLVGACTGFGLLTWTSAFDYAHNIGGKPPISVPMFIPITFECTILFAGLTTAIAMILMNGLPAPYHPVFNVERFSLASRSRFFLCIESEDHHFDRERTRKFLESLHPEEVSEVDH